MPADETHINEELHLNLVDECIIITGVVIGAFAIIVIILLSIQMINACLKKRAERKQNQFIKTKQGILIMSMTFAAFTLYLISLISTTFLRTTIIFGDIYHPGKACNITWFAAYPFNGYAKLMIWTTFLYRLYISFKDTEHPVPLSQLIFMLLFLWIFSIVLTVSAFITISNNNPFVEVCTQRYHIMFCGVPNEWPPGFTQLAVAIVLNELIMNIYTLYAFISRLYRVRKQWMQQLFEDTTDCEKISVNHIQKMSTSPRFKAHHCTKRILKMTRLIMKLNYLLLLTLISGWIYWGISLFYPMVSMLYGYNVIVNIICVWLLLGINEHKWNSAVAFCYYPCCCHKLCPTIRGPQFNKMSSKTPIFTKVKTISTATSSVNVIPEGNNYNDARSASIGTIASLIENDKLKNNTAAILDITFDENIIEPLDGYSYTKPHAMADRIEEDTDMVYLCGVIEQRNQLNGFFNGNIAQILSDEALPSHNITRQVTAVCNDHMYCASITIGSDGMINAQCSINFMNINQYEKTFDEGKDKWYLDLSDVSYRRAVQINNPHV